MITLTKEQATIAANAMGDLIRAGGVQVARIVLPVIDEIERQIAAEEQDLPTKDHGPMTKDN